MYVPEVFPNLTSFQLVSYGAKQRMLTDKSLMQLGELKKLERLELQNFGHFAGAFLLGDRFSSLRELKQIRCPDVLRDDLIAAKNTKLTLSKGVISVRDAMGQLDLL